MAFAKVGWVGEGRREQQQLDAVLASLVQEMRDWSLTGPAQIIGGKGGSRHWGFEPSIAAMLMRCGTGEGAQLLRETVSRVVKVAAQQGWLVRGDPFMKLYSPTAFLRAHGHGPGGDALHTARYVGDVWGGGWWEWRC